ncbi:MAG TPA: translation elongation factor 4 [Phycisphaerae bacterium]|nr:translation elongation factor 4 [Phycisphaerae bacterium]
MPDFQIRNFCIIAHIDHGKSTLADRLLERTGAITQREMESQFLDDMDLERERGITIKASAVSVFYTHPKTGQKYLYNLIDTPGHVDFHYEVAKALQACEGALLLCDATQGVQAQTVANAYAAIDQDLEIIPVINKVDLPSARPDDVAEEMEQVLGIDALACAPISAKTGQGVDHLLELIAEKLPAPEADPNAPLQALIFDSKYDDYRGVITYVRVFNGSLSVGQKIRMMGTNKLFAVTDLGKFTPKATRVPTIGAGEVGFIVANIKTIQDVTIGDTVTDNANPAAEPLPGYRPPKQMVFCDFYPGNNTEYTQLREALEKLRLNDSSFTFEPETSDALGFGFRCGFLGLLHMEIVQERLEREFKIEVVQTAPTVPYEVVMPDDSIMTIDSASELPDPSKYKAIREPMIKANIIIPAKNIGDVTQLCIDRRGIYKKTDYITPDRVILEYEMPLAEVIFDFFDKLKTATQGYGTLDYDLIGFHEDDLAKMDILVAGDKISALSLIVHRSKAESRGRAIIKKLKQEIDRHLFEVALQAAIGSRVIARETISALRKDVTSKCYGGDISRKRKLLEKQKEGKKRMKQVGRVEIPQEAFMSILEPGD